MCKKMGRFDGVLNIHLILNCGVVSCNVCFGKKSRARKWHSKQQTKSNLFPKPLVYAVSLSLLSILTACGGGGGDSSDKKAPQLSLNGEAEITLLIDQEYTEQGANAQDNKDGDLSSQVQITGQVDNSKVGSYSLNYNVSDSSGNAAIQVTRAVNVIQTGKAQLGPLVGATAEIYEIQADGSLLLVFTETTTDGDIKTAGQFNFHYAELDANKWYLAKVSGGQDIDANDDGFIDNPSTTNQGSIHLIFKKDWIQANKSTISVLSEIVYQLVKDNLSDLDNLEASILNAITLLFTQDINGDGLINQQELVDFDPIQNKDQLTNQVRNLVNTILPLIHENTGTHSAEILKAFDTTPPQISLIGEGTITLKEGDDYTEQGASAMDNLEGDISANIIVGGDIVNSNEPAT